MEIDACKRRCARPRAGARAVEVGADIHRDINDFLGTRIRSDVLERPGVEPARQPSADRGAQLHGVIDAGVSLDARDELAGFSRGQPQSPHPVRQPDCARPCDRKLDIPSDGRFFGDRLEAFPARQHPHPLGGVAGIPGLVGFAGFVQQVFPLTITEILPLPRDIARRISRHGRGTKGDGRTGDDVDSGRSLDEAGDEGCGLNQLRPAACGDVTDFREGRSVIPIAELVATTCNEHGRSVDGVAIHPVAILDAARINPPILHPAREAAEEDVEPLDSDGRNCPIVERDSRGTDCGKLSLQELADGIERRRDIVGIRRVDEIRCRIVSVRIAKQIRRDAYLKVNLDAPGALPSVRKIDPLLVETTARRAREVQDDVARAGGAPVLRPSRLRTTEHNPDEVDRGIAGPQVSVNGSRIEAVVVGWSSPSVPRRFGRIRSASRATPDRINLDGLTGHQSVLT